jgi:osmoprotectant transport system permease protein
VRSAGLVALAPTLALVGLFVLLLVSAPWWDVILGPLYPDLGTVVYDRASFTQMVLDHAWMVSISAVGAAATGIAMGVLVTRRMGREFLPAVNSLASLGQTFPPVAVLAMAVPAVGFGAKPTIIALYLYSLLPIVRNTIAGLEAVPAPVKEAATGMGMTEMQMLWKVELRLAMRVIMAGVRTSVVINIGTATIGATIGAGGLGAPIIAGLTSENPAFILEGAVVVGLFAIIVDDFLGRMEKLMARGM